MDALRIKILELMEDAEKSASGAFRGARLAKEDGDPELEVRAIEHGAVIHANYASALRRLIDPNAP